MSSFLSLYVTAPSREVAEKIARALVEERHAADVNSIAGARSTYRWKGALLQKSKNGLFWFL